MSLEPASPDRFPRAHGIPKLLHQSYKGPCGWPSGQWQEWSQGCRDVNADWQWVFWSDQDNRQLFRSAELRRYASTYSTIQNPVARADFARLAYMFAYGGVYLDLDIQCHRPIEALLAEYRDVGTSGARVIIGTLGLEEPGWYGGNRVPNAIMVSEPGHPLWLLCMELVSESLLSENPPVSVEAIAGPVLLERCLVEASRSALDYTQNGEVHIAPAVGNKTEISASGLRPALEAAAGDMGGIVLSSKQFT